MKLPRRRKYLTWEDVRHWKRESQFKRAFLRNTTEQSALTRAFIDAGRGNWRNAETEAAAKAGDPLALREREAQAEFRALSIRAEAWYGPGWEHLIKYPKG